VAALTRALARLITDKDLARKLELTGQEHVNREFQQERIWDSLYRAYLEVLQKKGPLPFLTGSLKPRELIARSSD
jgi:hypothetical protein